MENITKTQYYSYCTGNISKGCELCVHGRKLVLFISGLCSRRCFYCPVSEHKFGKDVVYANEWKIKDPDNPVELIEEAKLTEARGAGITGGDPLSNVDRCCEYIKLLKEKFGKEFHIHLYTSLILVTHERLKKLYEAGLDEIRFHPDLDDKKIWDNLKIAREFDWDVGVEIPSIPGYEKKTKELIDFVQDKVDFLNLNELELSDTQISHYKLNELGFMPRDNISYGTKGSASMAVKLLEYAKSKNLRAHFCTAKLKDGVQVKKRIQLRSRNVALKFDKITEDGLLVRGCIYLPELKPGYGKNLDRNEMKEKLKAFYNKLLNNFKEEEILLDEVKIRFITSDKLIKKNAEVIKKLGLVPAIVEEYPTADAFEAEVEYL